MYRKLSVVIKNHGNNINILHRRSYQSAGVYGYRKQRTLDYQIPQDIIESRNNQSNVYRWVEAYRTHGHRIANINPVSFAEQNNHLAELDLSRYGLESSENVSIKGIINYDDIENGKKSVSICEVENFLKNTYCGLVSAEFAYIECEEEREWLAEQFEKQINSKNHQLSKEVKKEIVELLLKSQVWDNFMTKKFPAVKRYGGEGAESMMAFFQQIFQSSTIEGIENIVLAMPHRGKLNVLTTLLNTPPAKMFNKFRGNSELPADAKAMADIASHFHCSEDLIISGKKLHVSMLHNPSHLEAVNPVSMGKTRSKQQSVQDGPFSDDLITKTLNVQLHGDAAFAGQGINQEMLTMAGTPHFDIGGTIHMLVNNQIGFTTPAERQRISRYSSDLAKSISAPVFHVNGDHPEMLSHVTKIAFDYQQKFRKDVFIDLNCFRRWGHNEVDDPTLTNPVLYDIIHARETVPDLYAKQLITENIITQDDVDKISNEHFNMLNQELANVTNYQPPAYYYKKQWSNIQQASNSITYWDTGLSYDLLRYIGEKSVNVPNDFNIHPHLLKTHVNARLKRLNDGMKIDFATAEALALGSLMYQGHNVRFSGEDVGRGTFAQRHTMLVDNKTNEIYIPLNSIEGGNGGKLEMANSILSEEAVLGFEYGMAIDNPNNLIIWEAQFGDFFNGAQIIIDTFIASGETKWMYANGLVMLLPHGYDGAASEHSSCRMERFLQLTDSNETTPDGDDINLQIINPSTPAQLFHALRRQIIRNFRKPLIVVAPKILLRLSEATSTHAEFETGTTFLPVIGDSTVTDASRVKKVILCSGKHYYALQAERLEKRYDNVALIRVESLCPFPVLEINQELDKYKNASVWIWSQEEHKNMGAWSFIKPRFENMCGRRINYYGRNAGATPAVGISSLHKIEHADIVNGPFQHKFI